MLYLVSISPVGSVYEVIKRKNSGFTSESVRSYSDGNDLVTAARSRGANFMVLVVLVRNSFGKMFFTKLSRVSVFYVVKFSSTKRRCFIR